MNVQPCPNCSGTLFVRETPQATHGWCGHCAVDWLMLGCPTCKAWYVDRATAIKCTKDGTKFYRPRTDPFDQPIGFIGWTILAVGDFFRLLGGGGFR